LIPADSAAFLAYTKAQIALKYQASDTGSTLGTKYDNSPEHRRAYPYFFTDFLTSNANTNPPWLGVGLTSGTLAANAAAQCWAAHPGLAIFKSASGANSGYLFGASTGQLLSGGEYFEAICYFTNLDSVIAYIGWHDGGGTGEATDGVYIKVTGDSVAVGKTASNVTNTLTSSTYTLNDSTWYRFSPYLNSDGSKAYFKIFNEAGAVLWFDSTATNIPTGAGRDTISKLSCVWTGTNTAKDLLILDWMAIWKTTALVR
jgi:hypothetical protein